MAILANANDILVNLAGDIAYLQDSALWIRDDTDTTLITALILFNDTDLGEPSVEKVINYANVDYIGAFDLIFMLDGTTIHTMTFSSKVARGTEWTDFPLAKRKAFQKLQLKITATDKTTKIYSIELDFNILKRRRYN